MLVLSQKCKIKVFYGALFVVLLNSKALNKLSGAAKVATGGGSGGEYLRMQLRFGNGTRRQVGRSNH